jgi:thiamine-monophosphate kinase
MERTKNKNENDLVTRIERSFRRGPSKALRVAVGDDAALWTPAGTKEMILTCDWFLEGTHFLRDKHRPEAVGWKCLARAVSDIAAMGGKPRCFLLSLALPKVLLGAWLTQFLRGLKRASKTLHCELAGGDTSSAEKVLISITVIGEATRGRAVLRSGAKPGDGIYISGTVGEAELGLGELHQTRGMAKPSTAALRKHLYPRPRLALGEWLAKNRVATAMMDLSDGLSSDLARLCRASRVGAILEGDSLPSPAAAKAQGAFALALHGGDDYELLFTVAKKNARRLPPRFQQLRLTKIGKITRSKKVLVKNSAGKAVPLPAGGWDPFRNSR